MTEYFADLLAQHPVDLAHYETLYTHFHSHPELSNQERETASTIAAHPALKPYTLHTSIGGHGLAGVLRNGAGPTVLLRADIDALPVLEKTGLPYASKVRMMDDDGVEKPVMHACGHDTHITCLLAAAEQLASIKASWVGTLVVLFQPNEERAGGAKAMVDDGLYEKVPVPDVVLGQHVFPIRAGLVASRSGAMMAAADSFKITVYGRGGHGSMPQQCVDPVVLASNIVLRLQGIVSREIDPAEAAVVTVGSLQAGETENIIAEEAVLRVNIRSQTTATREKILGSVRRIVKAECEASACPKPPLIEETSSFPLTVNDEFVAHKIAESFGKVFKEKFNPNRPVSNASEDVSILASSVGKPCCFWFFGGVDEKKWEKAEKEGRLLEDIPSNHSPYFAPVIQPTLKVGIEALCVAALTFLESKPR